MNETAKLLLECETSGIAPEYNYDYDSVINFYTQGKNILVVSDIHMGAGLGPSATYAGTENFCSDRALQRFLCNYLPADPHQKSVLVINGDFIDFLRITTLPGSEADFEAWQKTLENIGAFPESVKDLKSSIAVELKEGYGLKTDDYKSVWKLLVASTGHRIAFEALAEWLGNGNQIIIVKGNHDLEWYWLAVRNYFRFVLAQHLAKSLQIPIIRVLNQIVLPNIIFVNNAIVINKELYIEHGHRYDNFTKVSPEDSPVFNKQELNLPFGSFFNRYLINKVELRYPYFENVRPRMSLLPMLIKEDFPLAVRVLFRYIPFLIKTLGKKRYWPMIMQTFSLLFSILIPAVIVLIILFFQFKNDIIPAFMHLLNNKSAKTGIWGFVEDKLAMVFKDTVLLVISYFLSRILSMFQLTEPKSLKKFAGEIINARESKYPDIHIITFGHTHDPEQIFFSDNKWYYNSGTWIPVIEASSASIRTDRTYSFLRFENENGHIMPSPLLRWNDDAGREEELALVVPD